MVRNRLNKNDFTRYDRHGCFFSLKHWIAANEHAGDFIFSKSSVILSMKLNTFLTPAHPKVVT